MIIYFNQRGNLSGGGPSVWCAKAASEFVRRGHKIIFDNPERADWAIAIIETGKLRKQLKGAKTKILLRIDGIYNQEYNIKFNRQIRPDMEALHSKLKQDIPSVDCVVYQSNWSKDRIDSEIITREQKWVVINNGADLQMFKPAPRKSDGFLNLLHLGKMRDDYLMKTLIGTHKELKQRGIKCKLLLAGSMDGACQKEFASNKNSEIVYLGQFPNTNITSIYNMGDIFLGVRQGSSSDNVISEAQACGLPCIVPLWGGNVDMIKDQSTGVVVKTGHWTYDDKYINGIADAAIQISENLNDYKISARKHAEEQLSINKMMDKYLKEMR